ncbi:MAG: protein TolR [Mariprofundales bacterium]
MPKRWKNNNKPISNINVTPLVDVMLVLLIIFMITAPLLSQGVQVDLPDAASPAMSQQEEPLIISVRADGSLFLQHKAVALAQLAAQIQVIRKQKPNLPVYVRGDAKTPYENIAQVMGMLAGAGITKVGLVTEPERQQ